MNVDLDPIAAQPSYEPPTLQRLGTLAELTLGGDQGLDDGVMGGGAGGEGSIG